MLTIFKNIFTKLKGLFANLQKIQKPVNQAINNGEEEVLKEEHRLIQDVFFERMKAYRDWAELETHYPGQKEIFAVILKKQDSILKNINPEDVNSLSEENFRQLLLSTFKKIRKEYLTNCKINQILAKKENLTSDEIKQIVAKKGKLIGYEIKQILAKKGNVTGDEVSQIVAKKANLTDDEISQIVAKRIVGARGTEAKDILVKSGGGLFGIDTDPKDISGSIKRGVLKKLPFGGSKEEEDNQPSLRGTQVVIKFLRNSFLPIGVFAFSVSIFGSGGVVLIAGGIGLLVTEVKVVKSLFSNDKEGTVYNTNKKGENILFFSSHEKEIMKKTIENEAKFKQAEAIQKRGELRKKIGGDISEILSNISQNKETNKAAAPVIEQVTDPQKEQSQQAKVNSGEEGMSQTQWADTVRTGNKVGAGRS